MKYTSTNHSLGMLTVLALLLLAAPCAGTSRLHQPTPGNLLSHPTKHVGNSEPNVIALRSKTVEDAKKTLTQCAFMMSISAKRDGMKPVPEGQSTLMSVFVFHRT